MSSPPVPPWLSTLSQLLAKHGVGALIALFLVWRLAAGLEAKVDSVLQTVGGHKLLLQAICINTAKTDAERMTCHEAGGR